MPRRSRIEPSIKIRAVLEIINTEASISGMAKAVGVADMVIYDWLRIYENEGASGLLPQSRNKVYPPELKQAAAADYLSGKGSIQDTPRCGAPRAGVGWVRWYAVLMRTS